MHAACLRSWLRHGHRVVLHTFADLTPQDIPDGVETDDAAKLMSRDRVVMHQKSGSFALAGDIFRFELLAAGLGIYVDCDCFCVKPLQDADFLFGWESGDHIATGLIKLPKDSPLIESMRKIATTRAFIAPWWPARRQHRYRLWAALGFPVPLSRMTWGTLGPLAFTHYIGALGLLECAQPIDVFYPVAFAQHGLLRDPGLHVSDLITPRTQAVHLWNEAQRKIPQAPPPHSPLWEMIHS
jgi:hypothetical protein